MKSNCTPECYELLNDNRYALERMAEYVASYRLLMSGWKDYSLYHEQLISSTLSASHIDPLIKRLRPFYGENKRKEKELTRCIKKILDAMIASPEVNDSWSINLIIASIQQSFNWWPMRRPLRHELAIRVNSNLCSLINKQTLKTLAKKNANVTCEQVRSIVSKRTQFIVEHIPEYNGQDATVTCAIVVIPLMLALYLFIATENLMVAGISTLSPGFFAILYISTSALRPSYLEYQNMPNKLNLGLVHELKKYIQKHIPRYKKLERERNTPNCKDNEWVALAAPPFSKPPSNTATPRTSYYPNSDTTVSSEFKPTKKEKGTQKQSNIPPSLEAKETLNIYTWRTVDYGEVKYMEGKDNKDIVALWSNTQCLNEKYVSLFPRDKLTGTPDLIEALGVTANVGRFGRAKNQPGYIDVNQAQKTILKYPNPENIFFKIKLGPHSIFGKNRSLVRKCNLSAEDKPTPNRPILLAVDSPFKKK